MTANSGEQSDIQSLPPLIDSFGRRLNYLRISLTDRCNLRCVYCMPAEGVPKISHDKILRLEEVARVARIAVSMGVEKIRLTGGEPLIRRNIDYLLDALGSLNPRPDIRLTTNGMILARRLDDLIDGGVSTINISLDTLRPERFASIAGLPEAHGPDALKEIMHGIELALQRPELQLKLNVVPLAGLNEDELEEFAALAHQMPLAVRFIEYMPVGRRTAYQPDRFVSADDVLRRLKRIAALEPLTNDSADGPARRYKPHGWAGEIGVISAISSHFCDTCNRLRLTSDGYLIPCLFNDRKVALAPILRSGATDEELAAAIADAAQQKPRRHGHTKPDNAISGCQMSRIGG